MEVQAGNPFRCVTVLICYLGINILASQAQLPNFCRKTGVFLQKRSKPCDPDSDSAAAKRPVSPRRHRGPFDCGLPLADFGFGINERLLYQDKPKSAIQRVLRAPPCTPCLRGE